MFEDVFNVWLPDFSFLFLSILVEGAPFILLGTLISGFIDVYLPASAMDRLLPRNRTSAVLVSGLLGIIFPVCECAVVPVIRRLVKKGLPPACALTYMLAAPIVNPVTALSTASAFKEMPAEMAGSRLLFGYLIAVMVGLILLRIPVSAVLKPKIVSELDRLQASRAKKREHHTHDHEHPHDHEHEHSHEHEHEPEKSNRLIMALRAAMRDFVDVGIYFVIGITIVAVVNTPPPFDNAIPLRDIINRTSDSVWGAPSALMGLAFLLSLCSTSDAFIAASLIDFEPGALLAFLVFGPMMDVKLLFLYSTVLTKKFILYLAVGLFFVIGAISIVAGPLLAPDKPIPRLER